MTLPPYPKFQRYKSTHRNLSQSEIRVQRTLLKLPLIRFAKYDEDVYPCSLVIRSGWNPSPPDSSTPSPAITSRLDHRTGNALRTNWHIHRFPQRRGEDSVGWAEEGEQGRKVKSLDDKEGFPRQEKVNIEIVTSTRSYTCYCCRVFRCTAKQTRQEELSQKILNATGYVTGNSARRMRKSASVMASFSAQC